jgi:4-amino-4-deoxy-L-arabinose transferase-like glycosyltransferase
MIDLTDGQRNGFPGNQWTFWAPIFMSLLVLFMVAHDLGKFGFHATHHDETGADHIAMLLMFGQIPMMISFIAVNRTTFRPRVAPFAVQVALWALVYASARLT